MHDRLRPRPRADGRSPAVGAAVAALAVAATTALIYPLAEVAPVVSLGVVYLVAVLLVSSVWGGWLGAATALASALAFNFFHIPPDRALHDRRRARTGSRSASSSSPRWSASTLAQLARARTPRGRGAPPGGRPGGRDGAAAAARREPATRRCRRSRSASPTRSSCRRRRSSCAPSPATSDASRCRCARARRRHAARPRGPAERASLERLQRAGRAGARGAARRRHRARRAAARGRRDGRAAPLGRPQDRAAARRLARPALAADGDPDGRRRAATRPRSADARARASWWPTSTGEAERLSRLVDNLLDLSRLEARAAEPRRRVVLGRGGDRSPPSTTSRLPPGHVRARDRRPTCRSIRADAAQLERAFANLLENSARYSGGHPVSVRARAVGPRVLVRVVDRGPGVPAAEQDADLRAVLPRARRSPTATAGRASGWRSCAASSRPTAGACGSSRCPARATTLRRRAAARSAA